MVKTMIIAAPRSSGAPRGRRVTGKDHGTVIGSMVSVITDEHPAL